MDKHNKQQLLIDLLEKQNIFTNSHDIFFNTNGTKRLTNKGNIYVSMLKLNEEGKTYSLNIDISMETQKILDSILKNFYYLKKGDRDGEVLLTVYDEGFDIKIKLLGSINDWWEKIKKEYYE